MIREETFIIALGLVEDKGFLLKAIQADVLLAKQRFLIQEFYADSVIDRLLEHCSYNDITKDHFEFALKLEALDRALALDVVGPGHLAADILGLSTENK